MGGGGAGEGGDTEEWMIWGWGVSCGSCIINEKLFTNQIQFHQNSRDSLMGRWMDGWQETRTKQEFLQ